MHSGRSQLIGVIGAGRCKFFAVFPACAASTSARNASFLGDAKIQSPQDVGLHARGVKLALSLHCDHAQQLCPQMSKGLDPHEVALDLAHALQSRTLRFGLAAGQDACSTFCHSLIRFSTCLQFSFVIFRLRTQCV